ncbi:MAG: TetR/AcrR family transcriptional regulator [Comamonadaceae bacterium]|nr:MAG: TetR/AcrR family transcriptional regulator [Comamonadaceae bacterium]
MGRMNTPQPRRSFKEQMHHAREEAIVSAASRLLGEKGFEAMTVDEVAAAVGIAKASLYKHFAGKDDLCAAAMVHVVERMQRFMAEMPAGLDAMDRLRGLLRRCLELQLSDDMPILLSRNSGLAGTLKECDAYQASLQHVSAQMLGWIEQAQQAGQISPGLPPDVVLCALLARSADPLLTMLRERGTYSDAQIVEWAMQTCLNGLAGGAGTVS